MMNQSSADVIHGRRKASSRWFDHLSRIQKPLFRLFCFPYAGGSAHLFRQWQSYFPHTLDVCLVHLPGRGARISEPAFTRFPELITVLAQEIECYVNDEFALYGHSMGAMISFELARELFRRHGRGPRRLFLSGSRAPQCHRTKKQTYDLPHDEFIAHLRELNGTPQALLDDQQALELFMPTLRADFEMVQTYEYRNGPPLPCPLNIYGGLQDPDVALEELRPWQLQTTATCDLKMFEGDHFFIQGPGRNFIHAFRQDVLAAFHLSP
jgi:medium-chain acyl-[acyl-carrier-protein] hydrolase